MTETLDSLLNAARTTGTVPGLPRAHFIDGAWADAVSGALMDSFDPGHGVAFAQFAAGDANDIDRAVRSARTALAGPWARTSPAERGRILNRMAALLRLEADRFAVVESLDSGKRLSEAQGDVRGAIRALEYYAGATDKLEGASIPLGPDYIGFTLDEPIGVAAQIIPWNYPLSTATRGIAPALAAGCTIVAKPAEQTPFTALMLGELAARAGVPTGVLNVVSGTGTAAGAPLVAHPGIDHITFTGSVPTGIRVMQAAAENVTRLVLELGGKSPLAVMADANLDEAIEGVLGAIFENAGQICSAGSRLVVEHSIAEEFLARLVERTTRLRLGHGLLDLDVGPVNSALQLARIAGHVDRAIAAGNRVLTGGGILHPEGSSGWFFAPTIIEARGVDDPIVREEIFGPVLAVQVVADIDEAIAVANCTEFALVAGIYTADLAKAYRFARGVDAGQVFINEYFAGGIEVPFGGNRKSGFGREKGLEGLRSYCKTKSVVARVA